MKIFISQKMSGRPQNAIEVEMLTIFKLWDCQHKKMMNERIHSYNSENIGKDSIELLSRSLAMLAEADIVLVPKAVKQAIDDFMKENVQPFYASGFGETAFFVPSISEKLLSVELLKGCEFEFLIAKSYGKKVYTYDDDYTFEEV